VRRAHGFTVIELLVVMAIVIVLATMLVSVAGPARERSRSEATLALLKQIDLALQEYNSDFRDFPPDGYDREPLWDRAGAYAGTLPAKPGIHLGGNVYFGSGCLIYFLCHPAGANGKTYLTLSADHFSAASWDTTFDPAIAPDDPRFKPEWATCEILDAWGRPIHYDRVGDAKNAIYFQPDRFVGAKGLEAHSDQRYLLGSVLPTLDSADAATHVDPRVTPGGASPRNPNADLWSHGSAWGDPLQAKTNW
jgi:prepilin-type N-terminal cleavage/methylation domain-containing protein